MSPEAQRVAIAEFCGYPTTFGRGGLKVVSGGWLEDVLQSATIPDYLNDLNAMHEAEKRFTGQQRFEYLKKIEAVCGIGCFGQIHASAAQRAEALL